MKIKIAFAVLEILIIAFSTFLFINNQPDEAFKVLGGTILLAIFFVYYLVKNRN